MMRIFFIMLNFGCIFGTDDETFADQYASAYCSRLSDCYRASYEGEYDGEADECRESVSDQLDFVDSAQCDFDEDDAMDCLEDLRSSDCEDLFYDNGGLESCARVCGDWYGY